MFKKRNKYNLLFFANIIFLILNFICRKLNHLLESELISHIANMLRDKH